MRNRIIPACTVSLTLTAAAMSAPVAAHAAVAVNTATARPADAADSVDIRGDVSLGGVSVRDESQRSQVLGVRASWDVDYPLGASWAARLSAGLRAESGSSQSFFSQEYQPSSRLFLREAHARWAPSEDVELRLGALDQSFHGSPLLFSGATFPGARQALRLGGSRLRVELSAEQAIPSGNTTPPSGPAAAEPVPFYHVERIEASTSGRAIGASASLAYFGFTNLPSGAAAESRFLGNTVSGVGAASARFVHGFSGVSATAETRARLGSTLLSAGAEGIHNFSAPAGKNRAYRGFVEAAIRAGRGASVAPGLEVFRAESDSSPSVYNSATLAHNNRKGIGAGVRADFPDSRLSVEARFVRASTIETTPFQSPWTGLFLTLRKSYELL